MNGSTHTKLDYLKAYYYITMATYTVVILNYIFSIDTIAFNRLILRKPYFTLFIITLLTSSNFRSGIIILVRGAGKKNLIFPYDIPGIGIFKSCIMHFQKI